MVWMRADTADLAQRPGAHALAGHGDQALAVEATEVLAELDGSETERAWTRQGGEVERLCCMLWPEWNRFRGLVDGGHRSFPEHLEHGGLGIDLPARRSGASPTVTVEVLAGLAELGEGGKVGLLRVREADNGREALSVPAHFSGAGGELRMWASECVPGDVVEKVLHRHLRAAGYLLRGLTIKFHGPLKAGPVERRVSAQRE